jgi:hypothetical protein
MIRGILMDIFPFELLSQEHNRIISEANRCGVTMRLLGAMAFELRCSKSAALRVELGRTLSDLDYMALTKQWDDVVKLLTSLGYSFDERRAMLHGNERIIFFHPSELRVDVFFDQLDMCHKIDLRNRLSIHDHTISLADLLLEKIQIVQITEKDIIDIITLFMEHPVTEDESGINTRYIADRFAGDWGFYHSATTNLRRVYDEFIFNYSPLTEDNQRIVRTRIDQLTDSIEQTPKTLKWKARARFGTSLKWYRDVGDLVR